MPNFWLHLEYFRLYSDLFTSFTHKSEPSPISVEATVFKPTMVWYYLWLGHIILTFQLGFKQKWPFIVDCLHKRCFEVSREFPFNCTITLKWFHSIHLLQLVATQQSTVKKLQAVLDYKCLQLQTVFLDLQESIIVF